MQEKISPFDEAAKARQVTAYYTQLEDEPAALPENEMHIRIKTIIEAARLARSQAAVRDIAHIQQR